MRTEWWKPVIFDFHTDQTAGERFRCRILKLALAGRACWFAWSRGLYILLPLWNPVPAPLERVRSAAFDRGRPRAEPQP